ncbi:Uncharacterized protein TPAR_07420 [Tolypocladium paradoxum]|uniref:DUF4419 domain-containing protein n=1 Tax=Tolypocladium paradoxum TaxID=94208 RepID=A0A2S4KQC2_9HYPO|nr:Uncharacterized protein TPAR_07420 [Tolypocladium paradoxum]
MAAWTRFSMAGMRPTGATTGNRPRIYRGRWTDSSIWPSSWVQAELKRCQARNATGIGTRTYRQEPKTPTTYLSSLERRRQLRKMLLHLLVLGLSSGLAAGGIVVPISDVKPLPLKTDGAVSSARELFRKSCPEEVSPQNPYKAPEVLMSSYADFGAPDDVSVLGNGTIFASSDSLVRGAVDAWAQHQHLVLRPDVVWFEVLAQLNFYMSKHGEELRHLFVDFAGKQEIEVREYTWRQVVGAFGAAIQRRVKTDWLLGWIAPGFSTTTQADNLTATVLMMGLVQQYFDFSGGIICGLPSVQLLGERRDWARLLGKLERLGEFGPEARAYARSLRPILRRFVQTWDEPASAEVRAFWRQIVRADSIPTCGAGPVEYSISGWITGFLHWTADGSLRVPAGERPREHEHATTLDGVAYAPAPLDQLPVGYARVPLKMLDYPKEGTNTMAYLLGGNVGVAREAANGDEGRTGTLAQPLSAWFLYGPVLIANETEATSGSRGSSGELEGIWGGLQTSCPGGG